MGIVIAIILIIWFIQIVVCRAYHGMPEIFKSPLHNILFFSEVIFGIIVGVMLLIGGIDKFLIHN